MREQWDLKSMILYEDEEIIVCHKMAGVPVQSARMGTMDLESALKNYMAQKDPGKMPYIGVIHRLDQPVEGVIIFAKNAKTAAVLNRQFQNGEVEKRYLAVVKKERQAEDLKLGESKELHDFLLKDGRTNTSKVVSKETKGAKEALLSYKVVEEKEDRILLEVLLGTGRHHQIRVQLAAHGMPLEGDRKYGKNQTEGSLALCSYCLKLKHPKTGKRMEFRISPQGERYQEFSFCKNVK